MWQGPQRITVEHLLVTVVVLAVALGPAQSSADAQTPARGRRAAEDIAVPPLVKPLSAVRGQSARPNAGDLLWEDRHDVGFFEQEFSVATLAERTFVAGVVATGSSRDYVVRAYDAPTGRLAWQDRVNKGRDEFASGVAAAHGRVFVSGTTFRPGTPTSAVPREKSLRPARSNMFSQRRRTEVFQQTLLAAGR